MKVLGSSNKRVYATNEGKILIFPYSFPETWQDIIEQLNAGSLSKTFPVGSQFFDKWGNYSPPWDVVNYSRQGAKNQVELSWHYGLPTQMQFDAPEALFAVGTALSAGTYHITIGKKYGSGWVKGNSIQFTLSKAIPAGGQICLNYGYDIARDPANGVEVLTYEVAGSSTVLEKSITSAGTEGTFLGSTSEVGNNYTNGDVNAPERVVYGYSRWSQSAIRQYLNSSAVKGQWWTSQNRWDRPPQQISTVDGFLLGCSPEFLSVLAPVDVTTAVSSQDSPTTYDVTQDKIFIPSLQQMYVEPQSTTVTEGNEWEYYKKLAQQEKLPGKFIRNTAYAVLKKYKLNNISVASNAYFRSLNTSSSYVEWQIDKTGLVNGIGVNSSLLICPSCILQSTT